VEEQESLTGGEAPTKNLGQGNWSKEGKKNKTQHSTDKSLRLDRPGNKKGNSTQTDSSRTKVGKEAKHSPTIRIQPETQKRGTVGPEGFPIQKKERGGVKTPALSPPAHWGKGDDPWTGWEVFLNKTVGVGKRLGRKRLKGGSRKREKSGRALLTPTTGENRGPLLRLPVGC